MREWWAKNGHTTKERHKLWMRQNAEQQRQHRRHWREKNQSVATRLVREWRKNNPHKDRKISQSRRARLANAKGTFTTTDIISQIAKQNNLCFWCQIDMGDHPTIDHYFPLSKGGSNNPDNIVIACRPCNSSKGNKMPDEFIAYLIAKRRVRSAT